MRNGLFYLFQIFLRFKPSRKDIFHLRIAEEKSLNVIRITFVTQEDIRIFLFNAFNANFHTYRMTKHDRIFDEIFVKFAVQNILDKHLTDRRLFVGGRRTLQRSIELLISDIITASILIPWVNDGTIKIYRSWRQGQGKILYCRRTRRHELRFW